MAVILDTADAVVALLNAGEFSQQFTAERLYLPLFELPDMATLHVTVVPKAVAIAGLSRIVSQREFKIDVAVQQKGDETAETIDPLVDLVEEIVDYFQSRRLASPNVICTGVDVKPIYSQEHMHELRQFTSVLTLTFTYHVPR